MAIHEAVGAVADFVGAVNVYVTEQEPWKVAKDDSDEGRARLATILYAAAESLRAVAVLHNAVHAEDVRRAVVCPRRGRGDRAPGRPADRRCRDLGSCSPPGRD